MVCANEFNTIAGERLTQASKRTICGGEKLSDQFTNKRFEVTTSETETPACNLETYRSGERLVLKCRRTPTQENTRRHTQARMHAHAHTCNHIPSVHQHTCARTMVHARMVPMQPKHSTYLGIPSRHPLKNQKHILRKYLTRNVVCIY